MNCPKCNAKIGENDLICPNCKKVLRLKCPVCGAITKNSSCEKCGTVLLNKCYKCGKLNLTTLEKCPSCGMDMNASIGLRESLIEEFAVLTIEVTNLEDIKNAFKSDKIADKFKKNLYEMIKKLARQKKLRVQMIENTFIIRFCKDYTFSESCKSAVDFSIYVAQSVTDINQKLFEAKGVSVKTQMVIQKRDVYAKQNEYKSGLNINVVYSSSGHSHLFNDIEVAVDSYIYQETKLDYPFLSLSALMIKNKMVMFFELVLQKLIKIEQEKEEVNPDVVQLPKNVDFEPEEEPDEEALIKFANLHCSFLKVRNDRFQEELSKISASGVSNPIVAVCGDIRSGKLSGVSNDELRTIFPETSIIRFSCPQKSKFSPFGLFKEMILSYRNITEFDLLLNEGYIDAVTQENALRDLFLMRTDGNVHPEDLRFTYYEEFERFIRLIPTKTMFVIDDFDNVDESSLEILKYLVENKLLGNTGFLISCDEKYALHRKIYKLMTSENYFELQVRPTSNKKIVAKNLKALKEIESSFFLEKVLENTKGSIFYFKQALEFLVDENILAVEKGKYKIDEDRMIVIPSDINELIQKRIHNLQKNQNAYALFVSMLLCAQKLSFNVVNMFQIPETDKALKYLESENLIRIEDNSIVFVNNFNLYRENLLQSQDTDVVKKLARHVLDMIFVKIKTPHYTKAELIEFCGLKKEAFSQWHAIAMISSQLGDFCSYLNSTNKFLSLVDNVIDSQTDVTVEKIKMDVYAELASMLYKYYPDKMINFLKMILENLEEQGDEQNIKEVANKLVQSCLISGNYQHALEYAGKILSRTPHSSFNPAERNFNLNYFLINMVTLEIYFNLGRLNEGIELSKELFENIDVATASETILPEGFSKKQFNDAILDALFFVNFSRVIQLAPDRQEKLDELIIKMPNATCFKLLSLLNGFMQGQNIVEQMTQIAQGGLQDKYSLILFPMLQALISLLYKDYNSLANYIYSAKIQASAINFHQMELFSELLIGYAYQNLGNLKKAKQIYLSITDSSSDKGLKNITYLSWLLNAKLEFSEGKQEIALNIMNNALLSLEKDENASGYILLLFKMFYSELMINTGQLEQALFCAEQAFDSAVKNKIILHLPQIADILAFIYNQIISSNQPAEIQNAYKNKMINLQNTMNKFMQNPQA